MLFAAGRQVPTDGLGPVTVVRLLGEGGQGWVYQVRTVGGLDLALKWYKPSSAVPHQWRDLAYLLERGSPDPRFLWPLALAGAPDRGEFGYLMALRPERFLSMVSLACGRGPDGRPLPVSFAVVIDLCLNLAQTFLKLHTQGLCYRDISLGNVFFAPDSGEVLVCDVDNVAVDDGTSRVLGTGRFMAPEIVADPTGSTLPSTVTDRHSLAVLLFLALLVEHPLEGAKTDVGLRGEQHLREHFGIDPLFSLHPTDPRNRPLAAHVQKYWHQVYPGFVRDLFTTAFVDGLHNPRARVGEGQWARALSRLRDLRGLCPRCAATLFFDPAAPQRPCWSCGASPGTPLQIWDGRRRLVAAPGARVGFTAADGSDEVGRGVAHPQHPDRLGLHNVSDGEWLVHYPDGSNDRVLPGQAVALTPGLVIHTRQGVLRVDAEPLGGGG